MRIILEIPLRISEICHAVGAPQSKYSQASTTVSALCTDTRECCEQDLFIALDGEKTSGENYVSEALVKKCCVISKSDRPDVIRVNDTAEALLKIAALYKSKFDLKHVVAVTGSVGKSTTVKFISEILSTKYRVHSPIKNYNNHIGVPLTVLAMPRDTEVLVIELGMNHRGEISRLSRCIQPDVALITIIGSAHIGNLGSRGEIAQAKLEILDGMKDGLLFLPYNEPLLAKTKNALFVARNSSLSDISLDNLTANTYSFKSDLGIIECFTFFDSREHLLYDLALAISVAQRLGLSEEEIIKGIGAITAANLRQRLIVLNSFTIFDDSYNASLESISADLDFLRSLNTPTSAFLGDVLELGKNTIDIHIQIGRSAARSGISRLYLYGEYAEYTAKGAMLEGMDKERIFINTDLSAPEISVEQIKRNHIPGETILFKASHRLRLDKIADLFEKGERMHNDKQ